MTITFYKTLSEKNRVNKILTLDKSITGTLKEKTDVINPFIIIKTVNNFNVFNYNYCFIHELNRYYYIDNVKIINAVLYEIELTIDVLMTYKNDIEQSKAIITESTNEINANNTDYVAEKNIDVNEIDLDNPFTDTSDVLITIVGN